MNTLLVFFAIPIAVIILSIIFETLIKCPIKVAGIFFSIFLVVAFALGGTAELIVLAIVYTIISFITAYIVSIICNRCRNNCCSNVRSNCCTTERDNCFNNTNLINTERILTPPIVRNVYNENVEENNFTNAFNDNDNRFNNNLSSNNLNNNINNSCPYKRFR